MIRFGYPRLAMLAAIAILSLLAAPSALVAQQQTRAEQALTCAGIYFAVADNSRDPAMVAMLRQYRELEGINDVEAENRANANGLELLTRTRSGKLTGAQLVEGAEACSRIFKVALPRYDQRVVSAGGTRKPATVASAPRASTPPAPAYSSAECDRADKAFTDEMYVQADKLAEAGPRYTEECENGMLCGVRRPRSQFYYALGEACDALKARQKAARRVCPPERARELTIPEELGC